MVLTLEMGAERGMGIWGETVIWGMERGWRGGCGGWWRGGDWDLGAGDCYVEGHGEGDLGGGDVCLFCQARRVRGPESTFRAPNKVMIRVQQLALFVQANIG